MEEAVDRGDRLWSVDSSVVVFQNGAVEVAANESGLGCVASADTQRLVRDAAKLQVDTNPTNTLYGRNHIFSNRCFNIISTYEFMHACLFKYSRDLLNYMKKSMYNLIWVGFYIYI